MVNNSAAITTTYLLYGRYKKLTWGSLVYATHFQEQFLHPVCELFLWNGVLTLAKARVIAGFDA